MSMKERLKEAYESIRKKDPQAAAGVVEELKKLPRTQEGIFCPLPGHLFQGCTKRVRKLFGGRPKQQLIINKLYSYRKTSDSH